MDHHPVFKRYISRNVEAEPGFVVNFLGVKTRLDFLSGDLRQHLDPAFDNEYFEWIDVLETVAQADADFTILELGAGYGRWLVNASIALRQTNPSIVARLIGVEAEPTHFQWMEMHFRDNGLDPDKHLLVQSVVAARDGHAWFFTGHSQEWYGQSIAPTRWMLLRGWQFEGYPNAKIEKVNAVSLKSLLRPLESVDLIDLDIQGQEYEALKAAASDINQKVARVHIATHGKETVGTRGKDVENGLRKLFQSMEWIKINDYPTHSNSQTPYGKISFVDGVQTWVNPRFR